MPIVLLASLPPTQEIADADEAPSNLITLEQTERIMDGANRAL